MHRLLCINALLIWMAGFLITSAAILTFSLMAIYTNALSPLTGTSLPLKYKLPSPLSVIPLIELSIQL